MMNYIFGAMIFFSVICAGINGKMNDVTDAVISCGETAVTTFLSLFGIMVLWGGLMKIAERSGFTDFISKLLYPVLHFLFPSLKKKGEEMGAISMNITANLLGLGNAATPLGIEAMNKLQLINTDKKKASSEMVTFVLLNSASLHLIPTTVSMLRKESGSASPMGILLPGLLASFAALIAGLTATRLYDKEFWRRKKWSK